MEGQVPGLCPAIPGYCAQGFINTNCKFDCLTGADIDSICSADGTWAPYPTCEGDLRDTRDGCDGCPGPQGMARNRTAEAAIHSNTISDRRVPKIVQDNGGRKIIPSFAGNINIGLLNPVEKVSKDRFLQGRPTPRAAPLPTPPTVSSTTEKLISSIVNRERQGETSQPLTLFDRIKSRINKAKHQHEQQTPLTQRPQPKLIKNLSSGHLSNHHHKLLSSPRHLQHLVCLSKLILIILDVNSSKAMDFLGSSQKSSCKNAQ